MALRLATWNINSVRIRLDLVDRFLDEYAPDILCLQEIKAETASFPDAWFTERGYTHTAIRGQKGYHGVATLSRHPLDASGSIDWCKKGDARHVEAGIAGGIRLHNFYVPAGGDVPDVEANEKFAHKLDFLDEMIAWSGALAGPTILVGDLNVAPYESDVWSHKQLLNVVSHTPVETDRLKALLASHDWIDVMRHFVPEPERLFSWWSYRARDWRASDRGRRLDHIWISPTLAPALKSMRVIEDARGWEKPSDHAPVIADFDL
ncbi:MAG: exodeoxyribonuclease III [Sphingomonadales bacterium]|nr:exodeoxyribonuclease III [Sphingomonadales bacterium]